MFRVVLVSLFVLLSGCTLFPPNHLGSISATVSPGDYGQRLCAHVEIDAYPACVSRVLDYFEEHSRDTFSPAQATSGPFAVMMEGEVYLGQYASSPFAADFRVSNGRNGCRGSYNAFTGSADAIFDVYCDDGRSGWADIIRDTSGRNGIGKITLDDGTHGDIVFGYLALGAIES